MDNVGKKINIKEVSGVIMAYLGDSVWELFVRKYFIERYSNPKNINKMVKSMVNAKMQSTIYKKIYPSLSSEYQILGKRAKNGNIKTFPRSCTNIEYREATGFEAIIGGLFINGEEKEIEKLVKKYIEEEQNVQLS